MSRSIGWRLAASCSSNMHRHLPSAVLLALSALVGACVESEYEEELEAIDTDTDAFLDEELDDPELVAESRPSELPPEGWEPPSPACPDEASTQRCLAADKCFIFSLAGTNSLPGQPNSRGWNGVRGTPGTGAPDPNICYATNKSPTASAYDIAPCGVALCGPVCW